MRKGELRTPAELSLREQISDLAKVCNGLEYKFIHLALQSVQHFTQKRFSHSKYKMRFYVEPSQQFCRHIRNSVYIYIYIPMCPHSAWATHLVESEQLLVQEAWDLIWVMRFSSYSQQKCVIWSVFLLTFNRLAHFHPALSCGVVLNSISFQNGQNAFFFY